MANGTISSDKQKSTDFCLSVSCFWCLSRSRLILFCRVFHLCCFISYFCQYRYFLPCSKMDVSKVTVRCKCDACCSSNPLGLDIPRRNTLTLEEKQHKIDDNVISIHESAPVLCSCDMCFVKNIVGLPMTRRTRIKRNKSELFNPCIVAFVFEFVRICLIAGQKFHFIPTWIGVLALLSSTTFTFFGCEIPLQASSFANSFARKCFLTLW